VRDELAGRKVKCSSCGGVIPVPADLPAPAANGRTIREDDRHPRSGGPVKNGHPAKNGRPPERADRPAEPDERGEGRADRDRPRRKKRPKPAEKSKAWIFWLAGTFAVLLALGGVAAAFLFFLKGPVDNTPGLPPVVETPSGQIVAAEPTLPPAFLDERKAIPAGLEWSREVTAKQGGAIGFRITSQGPFAITVVTGAAFQAVQTNNKAAFKKKDVLLVNNCKGPQYQGSVKLPAGSSYFVIKNGAGKPVEFRLECFPPG
jgi:hypothetical protein